MARRTLPGMAPLILLVACSAPAHPMATRPEPAACLDPTMLPLAHPDTTVYDTVAVTERPRLLYHPPVVYPEEMKRAGVDGRAIVEAVVDPEGRSEPASIRVVSASRYEFGVAAVAVVTNSIWCPGSKYGHRVRVRVRVPFAYSVTRAP